jgi:hypothetical protein
MIFIDTQLFIFLISNIQDFWNIQQLVEKKLGKIIKNVRINNGGEYKYFEFNQFCQKWRNSMTIYNSMYTLQQNGVAKCKNRTLMEVVLFMLHNFWLLKWNWVKFLLTTNYFQNKTPTKAFAVQKIS